MRIGVLAALLLLWATVPATAQVSIGITIGSYPQFAAVPGYPVYYAPDVGANFFFYDGYYWVYQDDNWYSSTWYNGPWESVDPMYVPIFVLQIPVRYYQRPPQYFGGWQSDQAPHWNDHWGRDWTQRRGGWDQPQRASNVAPAPLPDYQRQYSGKDYPRADQQRTLQQQNYHYHSQSAGDRPNSGRQPDDRGSQAAQPSVRQRPTNDVKDARRDQPHPTAQQPEQQPRPAPQQQQEQRPRPTPQQQQERQPRPAPQQQEQLPRPAPQQQQERQPRPAPQRQQEQTLRPAPQQEQQGDHRAEKGKNQDQDHKGD